MQNKIKCNKGVDRPDVMDDTQEMPTTLLSSFNASLVTPDNIKIDTQLMAGHAGRGRNGYKPEIITIHTQAGNGNPYGWFMSLGTTGANAADCTIWNPKATNANLVRYIHDSDTPWTNGGWTEPINHANPVLDSLWRRGVYSGDVALTVENEGTQTLNAAQLERLAQLCAWWCGLYKIPADRNHIVGHGEIGPHKACPGFKLEPLVARVRQIMQVPSVPVSTATSQYFHETGFTVNSPFLDYWRKNGGVAIFGLPITSEENATKWRLDYVGSCQWFERCRLEFHDNGQVIMLGRVGAELLAKG